MFLIRPGPLHHSVPLRLDVSHSSEAAAPFGAVASGL